MSKAWSTSINEIRDFRDRTGVGINEGGPLLRKWKMLQHLESGNASQEDVVDILIEILRDQTQGLARYMK